MELHKALKEIIASKGAGMINNIQIINYLLDYQAFKEKPATKLILRDVINAGYGDSILSLQNVHGWQTKFKQYEHEFIDSCGYKEELAVYVFESIAYALGLNDGDNDEPAIRPSFNVDTFFDIPEVEPQLPANAPLNSNKQSADPTDLYTIALSFYNEGKYLQAKGFIEKAIYSQSNSSKISHMLRLLGDILMMIGHYEEAIKIYNDCFNQKAKEGRYAIDILKDYFKQHKIKGYENVMYCYFFCLYGAKRITDDQWLQFVKSEARYGLIDAIRYCADNGINPIDNHIDIYFMDRNQLKTGDYLYEDGSFAHELSKTKLVIAKIVLVDTSKFEKSQGWTHGYIIPSQGCILNKEIITAKWSIIKEDLSFPHSHYTTDDINHWDEIEKVESEHFIDYKHNGHYPVFEAIMLLNEKMSVPLGGASDWFLPSIHHIRRINGLKDSYNIFLPFNCREMWTSSQSDKNKAICFDRLFRLSCEDKAREKHVLPFAAF